MKIIGTSRSRLADVAQQRQPVHVGHRDVADDRRRSACCAPAPRLRARRRDGDLVARGGERARVTARGDRLVVDDHHLGHRVTLGARAPLRARRGGRLVAASSSQSAAARPSLTFVVRHDAASVACDDLVTANPRARADSRGRGRSDDADGAGPDEARDDPQRVQRTEAGAVEQLLERARSVDPPEHRPLALAQRAAARSPPRAARGPAGRWKVRRSLANTRASSGRAGSITSTIPGGGASSASRNAASAAVTAAARSPASSAARASSIRCAARCRHGATPASA